MSFIVKPCAGNTVFVINYPDVKGFDLRYIAQAIKAQKQYKITVETPHILLVKSDGAEVTVYSSGKLLCKKVKSAKEAEKLAEDFEKFAGK